MTNKQDELMKLPQPLWVKVEDGMPAANVGLYFFDGNEVYQGSFTETADYDIPSESSSYSEVITFAAYNRGFDGESKPIYGVTHWMYENIPSAPTS